jgi:hypothetical protein
MIFFPTQIPKKDCLRAATNYMSVETAKKIRGKSLK